MLTTALASALVLLAIVSWKTVGMAGQGPPAQPTDRFVTVDGLRIHYLDWGNPDKPPFLMYHGIGRVAHTFDHVAPLFRDNYHVIAVDMRGHGDSAWDPAANYLVEDHVKDVEGLVDQLHLRNITMLGNSTGGRVVQVFAGLHPDLMSGLIVEDVGPERPKTVSDNFARQVREEANGWASEDELVAGLKRRNPGVAEALLRNFAHYGTKRSAEARFVWKRDPNLAKGFVETELWRFVRRITCPTIYILGGRSVIVPAETQAQLKTTIPGVEIVTMPGLGHYPDEEAPAEFMTIVKRFLAATPDNRSARPTAPRVAPRAESQWTEAERALAAQYSHEASAANGFHTFLNHPELVKGVMPFFNYMSEPSSLSARQREILILRAAWVCRSEYLWAHHAAAAAKAGLSRDEMRRIAEGPDAPGWDPFEATLLRLADELHHTAFVRDATWRALSARHDTPHLIDAVFVVNEFTMISGMYNSLGVQIEPGIADRFPAGVAYRVTVPKPEPALAAARITPLEPSEWTPAARAMLEPNARNNYVIALYRTYARNEKLFPPRQIQSEYIRLKSTLSAHVRELLILRTGWLARAEYEWAQHAPTGRRAGLDTVRIAQGADAPGWDPIDATLVRAADELYRDDCISDATWNALAARFDAKALMDMLVTAGGYRQVSMSANAFGVQLEKGAERFPEIAAR